jgi:hypothetical protein
MIFFILSFPLLEFGFNEWFRVSVILKVFPTRSPFPLLFDFTPLSFEEFGWPGHRSRALTGWHARLLFWDVYPVLRNH